MPRRPIIDDRLYAQFLTFSVAARRKLLVDDPPRRFVLGLLGDQLARHNARCVGFVVMPDHVHAIVWLPEVGMLSHFVHGWKRRSSLAIRAWLESECPAYVDAAGHPDRFWQPRYYAFAIHSRAKLEEKLSYIHQNPVHAGLVDRPEAWPWSSARYHIDGRSVGVPISWPPE